MGDLVKDNSAGCLISEPLAQELCDHLDHVPVVPTPDNRNDIDLRGGNSGVSDFHAREDHKHPVRRQANPGDPVIVSGGTATIDQNTILDRWSDEESYAYAFRTLIRQPAGIGWGWISIPNIVGFQRPQLTAIGSYRPNTSSVQADNGGGAGGDGAGPRGPFMGCEVHHWSSTQRIYGGYYRRDNEFRAYVEYIARYIRT